MIAWKLITHFNKQRHLFFEKIETDYIIETYICSCGHTDFITKHQEQKPKYICKDCKNTKFYDANSAWKNIGHFLYRNIDLKLSYEYDIQSNSDSISSLYVTQIPKSINFSGRKVIYSKKPVYSLILRTDGDLKENYSLRFEQKILSQLKNNLTQYINKYNHFNIPDFGDKNLTIATASFFLKNQHLRDFDFYYWDDIDRLQTNEIYINDALELISNYPKEKSIKKAVYQNYLNQLDINERYYSSFVEAFTNNIKDINILLKLLELKFEYSMYSSIDKEELDVMVILLIRHYSEKKVLKFFNSKEFNSECYLFQDAVGEFLYNEYVIENKFRKVPCKVQALHDEFGMMLKTRKT